MITREIFIAHVFFYIWLDSVLARSMNYRAWTGKRWLLLEFGNGRTLWLRTEVFKELVFFSVYRILRLEVWP
jgi:hypothetical protein